MAGDLVRGFEDHDLLTYASAISFQILTAVIPFLLFVLALTGLIDSRVWHDHLEPEIRANVSPSLLAVIQEAVRKVLTGQRVVWATIGGGLALWQVSGAVRAVMGALGRIYESPPVRRPFLKRYSISFLLSIELGVCFTLTAACLLFAPFFWTLHSWWLPDLLGLVVRWLLAIATLLLVVGLLVRHAPACAQPAPWVSLGAGIVIASWLIVSFAFYLYLTDIASYQSVFGDLAAVIVALAYLYVSTTAFLFGAQLDAIIRARTTGSTAGMDQPGPSLAGDECRTT